MRKVIYFLILIFLIAACQKRQLPNKTRYTPVNVGTTANDGTGDNLRAAFQKVNAGFVDVYDSLGNIYTESQTDAKVEYIIDTTLTGAYDLSDYALMQADTNTYGGAMTYNGVINYVATHGGSGSGGYEWTSFIVGTTSGAPANTDTSLTIAAMAGDVIELYRGTTADLHRQWLNETATNGKTGYRYNSSGAIVVRPAWATNDRAYIKAVASGAVTKDALTGSGGGSSLLDDLVTSYDLNEISGTTVNDNLDTYDGTYYGGVTLNTAGKFGVAPDFDGTDDRIRVGTATGLRLQTFTLSFWVNTTSSGSYEGLVGDHITRSAVPYGYRAIMTTTGKVEFAVYFSGSNNIITSSTSVNTGAWVNVICTFDGTNTNVYINNGASEDTDATGGTVVYHAECTFDMGDSGDPQDMPYDGKLDAVHLWSRVLTSGERTLLQTYTYPFE